MTRIYVASSWRNSYQPQVVERLRGEGHEVYDFRNPAAGNQGFHWSEIDPDWLGWEPATYRKALAHPVAQSGFESDFSAMQWADVCVLVLPSGRSAHVEAGFMAGSGKRVIVLIPEQCEPELMYLIFDVICVSLDELIAVLSVLSQEAVSA